MMREHQREESIKNVVFLNRSEGVRSGHGDMARLKEPLRQEPLFPPNPLPSSERLRWDSRLGVGFARCEALSAPRATWSRCSVPA